MNETNKKFISAMSNVAEAMMEVVNALKEQSKASADKGAVKKFSDSSGIAEDIKSMALEIKSIASDTKKIIANQEKMMSDIKDMKKDKKSGGILSGKKEDIKSGIQNIIMIAGAVLAIGLAFKLIGSVNFGTVIAMAIALPLLAIAFEKIGKAKLPSWKHMLMFGLIVPIAATSLMLASWIMKLTAVVSPLQLLSAVGVAITLGLAMIGIGMFIKNFKKAGIAALLVMPILPIIAPSIALAIAVASWSLKLVAVLSPMQLLSAIGVALALSAVSIGIAKLMKVAMEFQWKDFAKVAAIVGFIGVILVAGSLAIMEIDTKGITLEKLLAVTGLGLALGVIMLAMAIPLKIMKGVEAQTVIIAGLAIIAMLAIIYGASKLLEKGVDEGGAINLSWFNMDVGLSLAGLAIVLGLAGIAMAIPINMLKSVSPADVLKGGLALLGVVFLIRISSEILSGVTNFPVIPLEFILAMGAVAAFATAIGGLGMLFPPAMMIQGVIAFILGVVAIVVAIYLLDLVSKKMVNVAESFARVITLMSNAVNEAFATPVFSSIGNAATFMISIILVGIGLLVFGLLLAGAEILKSLSDLLGGGGLFDSVKKGVETANLVDKQKISDNYVSNMTKIAAGLYAFADNLPGVSAMGSTAVIMDSILKSMDVLKKVLPSIETVNKFSENELKNFKTKVGEIGSAIKEFVSNLPGESDIKGATNIMEGILKSLRGLADAIPIIRDEIIKKSAVEDFEALNKRLLLLRRGFDEFLGNTRTGLFGFGGGGGGVGEGLSKVASGIDKLSEAIKRLKESLISTSFIKPLNRLAEALVVISVLDEDSMESNVDALSEVLSKVNIKTTNASSTVNSFMPSGAGVAGGSGGAGGPAVAEKEEESFKLEDLSNAISDVMKEEIGKMNEKMEGMANEIRKIARIADNFRKSDPVSK